MPVIDKIAQYNRAVDHAKSKGGKCLSTEYKSDKEKMLWKCDNENHSPWHAIYYSVVKNKSWCPECGIEKSKRNRMLSDALEKAKMHAQSKNGQCLSDVYINAHEKLLWKCHDETHETWFASYTNVMNHNRWCPECAGKLSPDKLLLKAKKYAESKNGLCLSEKCTSATKEDLLWKCDNNLHNPWYAKLAVITHHDTWCPQCGIEKNKTLHLLTDGLERAKQKAKEKGGECLSTEYLGSSQKMLWKCDNPAHLPWEARYANIVTNTKWCPYCAGKLTNEQYMANATKKAESRGGKCLSTEYINNTQKMLWDCDNTSHPTWKASYSNVVNHDRWCPKCSEFFYKEHNIRLVLEYLLDTQLPKIKLDWNINPKTGKLLELDGYSEDKRIAFEFQGRQHYGHAFGSKNQEEIDYIKYKDKIKQENCLKNNVKLLIINDNKEVNQVETLLIYLLNIFKEEELEFKSNIDINIVRDLFNEMVNHQEKFLQRAKEYAESRGGQCLSETYVDKNNKLEWKCDNETHPSWFSNSTLIYKNTWCRKCSKEKNC